VESFEVADFGAFAGRFVLALVCRSGSIIGHINKVELHRALCTGVGDL